MFLLLQSWAHATTVAPFRITDEHGVKLVVDYVVALSGCCVVACSKPMALDTVVQFFQIFSTADAC